jgi:hypothetical protein
MNSLNHPVLLLRPLFNDVLCQNYITSINHPVDFVCYSIMLPKFLVEQRDTHLGVGKVIT